MVLDIHRRPSSPGDTIEFSEVLLVGGEGPVRMGSPTVPAAKVLAQVQEEVKGKKLDVLHWRRRKSSRTHTGHRQRYTRVAVKKIITGTEEENGA